MLWIRVEFGTLFEGTQDQFRDWCYFDHATLESINEWAYQNDYDLEVYEVPDDYLPYWKYKKVQLYLDLNRRA